MSVVCVSLEGKRRYHISVVDMFIPRLPLSTASESSHFDPQLGKVTFRFATPAVQCFCAVFGVHHATHINSVRLLATHDAVNVGLLCHTTRIV
jgi:hypothetical protein